jgi:hypothetical protein
MYNIQPIQTYNPLLYRKDVAIAEVLYTALKDGAYRDESQRYFFSKPTIFNPMSGDPNMDKRKKKSKAGSLEMKADPGDGEKSEEKSKSLGDYVKEFIHSMGEDDED